MQRHPEFLNVPSRVWWIRSDDRVTSRHRSANLRCGYRGLSAQVAAETSHKTLRSHTFKRGERQREAASVAPTVPAPAIAISLDSTYIRSCHEGERHIEVRVGNAEMPEGGRQVFGVVAQGNTDVAALIRRALDTVGHAEGTALTAFTDRCSGLRCCWQR